MAERERDREIMRVFDWDTAAQILREKNATVASAGLRDSWSDTWGVILKDGTPIVD